MTTASTDPSTKNPDVSIRISQLKENWKNKILFLVCSHGVALSNQNISIKRELKDPTSYTYAEDKDQDPIRMSLLKENWKLQFGQ